MLNDICCSGSIWLLTFLLSKVIGVHKIQRFPQNLGFLAHPISQTQVTRHDNEEKQPLVRPPPAAVQVFIDLLANFRSWKDVGDGEYQMYGGSGWVDEQFGDSIGSY
jgi:hypothetical protein